MRLGLQFSSIRTKLTFWLIAIALVPLLVITGIDALQTTRMLKEGEFEKLAAVRDRRADQINDWLDERVSDVLTLADDWETEAAAADILDKPQGSETDTVTIVRALFNHFAKRHDMYEEIFLLHPKTGKVMISTNRSREGDDRSNDECFSGPLNSNDTYIKDIYLSKITNKPSMAVSTPVRNQRQNSDTITGIVVARIDLGPSLYTLLHDRRGLGQTGETFIVNKDAVALNELRAYENAPFNLQIKAKPATMAAQGKTGITKTLDYNDEEVLAAFTRIERTGWGLVAKRNVAEIYAPIEMEIWSRLVFVFAAVIVVYLIAFFLARSLSKPVISMMGIAEKMQAGDLSVRHQIDNRDEIGSLAKSLNTMADTISSQITVQQGSAEIMEVMVTSNDFQGATEALLKKLIDETDSDFGACYVFNEGQSLFEHVGSVGISSELLEPFSADLLEGQFGKALSTRKISIIRDIPSDTVFKFKTFTGTMLPKEIITIPLLAESRVIAIIALATLREYSHESIEILDRSWIGVNTGISNLIANEKTRQLTETLNVSNQELQSQAEELQSQSEELQEQNVELQAQREQVEQATRLKSEFLSNMSHELRTPLNSVLALSRVLIMQASDRLSEKEGSYLEIIERNGKKLLALINDILDISKIEAGKMDVSVERFSLNSTIGEIDDRLKVIAENKGIVIEQDISQSIHIESDRGKLDQVLQNLISNAVKFTEHGKVAISARIDEGNVYIEVTDTGVGIPENELPYIFDEFRQVDGSTSRHFEGTGLGLAIVKKFVEILGGNISASSRLGEGSTFSLVLPIEWQGSVEAAQSLQLAKQTRPQPQKETILVVDDEPAVVEMIAGYLAGEGYSTLTATCGQEALKLAKAHHPLAMTLDVMMPDMDGWEVLQKLKNDPETADINVIIASMSDDRETGFALGAVGHITKLVKKEALTSEILDEIRRTLGKLGTKSQTRQRTSHNGDKTILLVEDNESATIQVKTALESKGFVVDTASDGQQALDYLARTIPDGVVLDLMMPGIDGFDVLDNIRSRQATVDVPVLVITAKDLTADDLQRLNAGRIQYLVQKGDVDRQGLLNRIEQMLGIFPEPKAQRNDCTPKSVATAPVSNATRRAHVSGTPRILVIEDNPDNRTTLRAVLEDEFDLIEAEDGEQGLELIVSELPDLVLLDMALPGIDGFTVVRKIRENEKTADIPVIALTARAMKGDREETLAAGCDDYVSKPFEAEELLAKMSTYLGKVALT